MGFIVKRVNTPALNTFPNEDPNKTHWNLVEKFKRVNICTQNYILLMSNTVLNDDKYWEIQQKYPTFMSYSLTLSHLKTL